MNVTVDTLPIERESVSPRNARRSWSVTRPAQAGAGVSVSALGFTVVVAWLMLRTAHRAEVT